MALQGIPPILAPPAKTPKGVRGGVGPPPKPTKNVGPLKCGIGPLPVPKAKAAPKAVPKAERLQRGIPKTFQAAPKLAKAYQKAPYEPYKAPSHSLFSLHTLGDALEKVGEGAVYAQHKIYGEPGAKDAKGTVAPGAAIAAPVPKSFTQATAKDVLAMGELPFVGGLKAGEAAIAGVKGNLGPAKELGKGIIEGTKHGALGELVQGHVEGAEKAFQHHPGFTLAEAGALGGIAGRTAGANLRAAGTQAAEGGVRGALARAGSTVRPPIALTDEAGLAKQGAVKERTYSKDSIRKAAQVAADKTREPLKDARGKVVTYKDPRGREVPVLRPRSLTEEERLQAQRANYEAGRNQSVQLLEREKARKTANEIEPRAYKPSMRVGNELSHLVASGRIRSIETFKEDLQKIIKVHEDAIAHPEQYRTKEELKAAKENLKLLRKAAANPKVLEAAPEIVRNGIQFGHALNKGDVRLGELNIHPPEELERAALGEYAVAHMGATHHEVNGEAALRTPKGEVLTNEAIRRHAAESGRAPESIAHVPHIIAAGRKSSFYRPFRPGSRPVYPGQTRTFALQKRGSATFGNELTREELVRKNVTASNAESIDRFVHEAGLRRPDGKHFNAKEAMETANRLNSDGRSQWVAVRAFAAKLDAETQQKLKDSQSPAAMETAHEAMLNDRIVRAGDTSATRNVVLVPKPQLDVLMRHLKPAGEAEKLLQLLNGPFRMAVLPQPKWLTGNILEPYVVRLPFSGAGINIPGSAVDFHAAGAALKALEDSGDARMVRAAHEIQGMQMGGLLIGRRGASIRRTYEDFPGGLGRKIYALSVVRHLPVTKQLGDLILTIPHLFFAFNRKIVESPAQKIAFGKQFREDYQQFTGSWMKTLKVGGKALDEVSKGLVNTATQHRFMEEQFRLLGQYDGFNPTMRRLVQTAFPFLPWTLNSLRFVYWTLPAHHTVAFTALAKAAQHVQAEWEAEHKDVPPGTLKDAVKQRGGGLVDISKYTPFGATIPMAYGQYEGLPSQFMPQLSGAQKALEGQDPFGRPLEAPKTKSNPKGKPTSGQKLAAAGEQTAESLIPLLSIVRRLQEGGGTSYGTSTIFHPQAKPGTSHQGAFNRVLNPFRPTYLKAPKKGKEKSTVEIPEVKVPEVNVPEVALK